MELILLYNNLSSDTISSIFVFAITGLIYAYFFLFKPQVDLFFLRRIFHHGFLSPFNSLRFKIAQTRYNTPSLIGQYKGYTIEISLNSNRWGIPIRDFVISIHFEPTKTLKDFFSEDQNYIFNKYQKDQIKYAFCWNYLVSQDSYRFKQPNSEEIIKEITSMIHILVTRGLQPISAKRIEILNKKYDLFFDNYKPERP